jgi:hypothetical protein
MSTYTNLNEEYKDNHLDYKLNEVEFNTNDCNKNESLNVHKLE